LIYLVDDETLLLDLAELSLLPEGYRVKKFKDPKTALESFLNERSKPILLITDYAMRTMSGLELIHQCKIAHPPLRSILLSGTAGVEIVDTAPIRIDHFMRKPYQPATLTEMVRRLLKQSSQKKQFRPARRQASPASSLSS